MRKRVLRKAKMDRAVYSRKNHWVTNRFKVTDPCQPSLKMVDFSSCISEVAACDLDFLTTDQMIEVDRLMTDVLEIRLIQMMENAGRNLARLCVQRFLHDPATKKVAVLAGTGGNGGGALVAARRLHQWGADVRILITKPEQEFAGIPAHQLGILRRLGVAISHTDVPDDSFVANAILDGVIGYSLKGNPRGRAAELIEWAGNAEVPVLSLDVPSGVDSTEGVVRTPSVIATATMTLAAPKVGLSAAQAQPNIGELYVADIGVPDWVYQQIEGLRDMGAVFGSNDIVKLI